MVGGKMKYLMFAIIIIITLSACELTSPVRFENDMLVIAGYLQAGKAVSIDNPVFVGKTVAAEGGHFFDIFLDDAFVTIEDINLTQKDTLYFGIYGTKIGYYNDNLIIQSGHSYKISVRALIDSMTINAYAITTVPDSVVLNLDYYGYATPDTGYAEEYSSQLPKIKYSQIEEKFPVYSRYANGDVIYSYYHYYCLAEFSTALEFTNPIMGYNHLEEDDEESYNSPLSYNMRESTMIWRYQPLQDEQGDWFLLEETYDGGFTYYAPYRLTIYSVDQNFYTYKYHSESYFYGGIQGGIGYFGSVAGEDFFTEIIK
jgi:hypothetical protein